jgi:hypothetical protein
LDSGKQWRELRLFGGEFSQAFRRPKHLICIPADPGPPQGANLIDDVRRVSSTGSQIAAMDYEVRCNLPQVGENRFEGAPIAVNIRYDCDSHFVRCRPCDNGLAAARYNFSRNLLFGFKNGTDHVPFRRTAKHVLISRRASPEKNPRDAIFVVCAELSLLVCLL